MHRCAAVSPRMRRTPLRRRSSTRFERPSIVTSSGPAACTSRSPPRKRSSCARAKAPGARCSRRSASRMLDSATRVGARALGFDADYGTIDAGKRARLLAVDIPPRVDDVEEYLVSGVHPDQIHWVDEISELQNANC